MIALRMLAGFVLATLVLCQASVSPSVASEDKLRELIRSTGFVEIKLIEAHVPDMDPAPLQGKSDVFVKVYLNETNELICETPIEQDNNSPKFHKECSTLKMVPSDSVIRIELYDSDKPADPDTIGVSHIRISDLILNRKLDTKQEFPIEKLEHPKYYIKARIDFRKQL